MKPQTHKQFKLAVTFGRFNLLHRGHILLFDTMCRAADVAIIGVSQGRDNLPVGARMGVIAKACDVNGLAYSLKVAHQPFELFDKVSKMEVEPEEVVAFFGIDQAPLAKAVGRVMGWHTETINRLTSSTAIRALIDSEEWDLLSTLLTPEIMNDVINLRKLELDRING